MTGGRIDTRVITAILAHGVMPVAVGYEITGLLGTLVLGGLLWDIGWLMLRRDTEELTRPEGCRPGEHATRRRFGPLQLGLRPDEVRARWRGARACARSH